MGASGRREAACPRGCMFQGQSAWNECRGRLKGWMVASQREGRNKQKIGLRHAPAIKKAARRRKEDASKKVKKKEMARVHLDSPALCRLASCAASRRPQGTSVSVQKKRTVGRYLREYWQCMHGGAVMHDVALYQHAKSLRKPRQVKFLCLQRPPTMSCLNYFYCVENISFFSQPDDRCKSPAKLSVAKSRSD